ncbi:MAG TPA: phospho-sugar mutase [Candidatus Excrementavichristensenella intestinipullorum]|nr:phospho-sugar mutase [Candidatus Excrementavichristensenella intestinipullorum]
MSYQEEYQRWLEEFKDDAATHEELLALEGNEREIEDRFYTMLSFGTAGMRGVLGAGLNRMNVYNVRRATAALAQYILSTPGQAERGVAIAYDSRRFSEEFARQAALTLAARGVRAYLFESLRPVPVLSFTIRHLGTIAGIVITASHNPPEYNGYKVYWEDGGQMPPDRAGEITKLIDQIDYAQAQPMDAEEAQSKGLVRIIGKEVDDAYIAAVKKLCVNPQLCREMGDKLKIVYTPLHGSGNVPVRRILKELGFKQVYVVPEQELPDPNFSTVRLPNPEDPAAFTLALKLQESLDADVVFGTDPDCDRVGIAVKDGQNQVHILSGNQIGCLLLNYILSQKAERGTLPADGAVVKSIVSTEMARAICQHYGVTLFDVLTGFKFIAEMIHRFEMEHDHTFLFGFEESYGFLSGTDVRDKDGVNACMLIAETAAWYKKRGKTLYDALMELFETYGYYGEKVTSFSLSGKDGLAKMKALMKGLRDNPPQAFGSFPVLAVRDYQTGLRLEDGQASHLGLPVSNVLYYELDRGAWLCVRPSGTEPKIKLYVNAVSGSAQETQAMLEEMSQAAVALLERG